MTAEKPIRLAGHCRERLPTRGTSESEIADAIRNGEWQPAERGRTECSRERPYGAQWNGKWYATKKIRPIFEERDTEIVVVTVYTYYY